MTGDTSALKNKPIIITGGGGGIALEAGLHWPIWVQK